MIYIFDSCFIYFFTFFHDHVDKYIIFHPKVLYSLDIDPCIRSFLLYYYYIYIDKNVEILKRKLIELQTNTFI